MGVNREMEGRGEGAEEARSQMFEARDGGAEWWIKLREKSRELRAEPGIVLAGGQEVRNRRDGSLNHRGTEGTERRNYF